MARLVSAGSRDVYELTTPERSLRIGRQARRTLADAELEAQALAEAQATMSGRRRAARP
jgi:hypothetical protein